MFAPTIGDTVIRTGDGKAFRIVIVSKAERLRFEAQSDDGEIVALDEKDLAPGLGRDTPAYVGP